MKEVEMQIMRCFDVVLVNARYDVRASAAFDRVFARRCV